MELRKIPGSLAASCSRPGMTRIKLDLMPSCGGAVVLAVISLLVTNEAGLLASCGVDDLESVGL
ncbi:hypothetical protein RBJ75_20175 [Rhodopseudomonas sp. BAL398]|uniref:hypothetical protein n=1 Tax=Rhodopseudomonas sp. BAL398 TaxID=3034676 RepID=UPI00294B7ED5|nr:hypothetical protein [Rhodopseudomonas sp. BAL398]MDF3808758.1 hypothetical protein [Rhodopseudomonas sp. BAL398]WOK16455.1 hypothetical protein RBJ75_20175 [Rhodopseudomonas sp. BAL398]